MPLARLRLRLATASLALVLLAAPPARAEDPAFVHVVDFSAATDGSFVVAQTASGLDRTDVGSTLTFHMPNWEPGAYEFQAFGERVADLAARAGAPGAEALPVTRPAADTWKVERGTAESVVLTYRLPVGRRRAGVHFTGPETFLYLEGFERRGTHELRLAGIPAGWTVATGLSPLDAAGGRYLARDYDELVDCPVTCAPLFVARTVVKGCPVEYTYDGDAARARRSHEAIVPDVAKIVAWQFDFFGEVPFDRYVFHFTVGRRGGVAGLEHRNSTEISLSADAVFESKIALSVIAHEFFHLWNVKRIRSRPIHPFDYLHVPEMDALWFHEGVTDYYASVCLLRTGIYDEAEFLAEMARAWSACNSTDDYYTRGTAWGFALDLEIRRRTDGRRSLDDVLREMNWIYAHPDRGVDESPGILAVVDAVAQSDLSTKWLPIVLDRVDCEFAEAGRTGCLVYARREISRTAYLGVQAEGAPEGGVVLQRVVPGSPAARAGLEAGDRLLRLGADELDAEGWRDTILGTKPGSRVNVRFVRGAEEKEVAFEIGSRSEYTGTLRRARSASPEARRAFDGFAATGPFRPVPEPAAPGPGAPLERTWY